jgi:hypothetical protein
VRRCISGRQISARHPRRESGRKLGYSRDGKSGTLQVNWGLLTDDRGCPVAVSVFEGNTGDPKTRLPQVEKVRAAFGIERLIMAGDRGMISNVQIDAMRALDGVDWITALKSDPQASRRRRNLVELGDRGRNQVVALGRAQPGQIGVAAGDQPLAGKVVVREGDQVPLVEQWRGSAAATGSRGAFPVTFRRVITLL